MLWCKGLSNLCLVDRMHSMTNEDLTRLLEDLLESPAVQSGDLRSLMQPTVNGSGKQEQADVVSIQFSVCRGLNVRWVK